MKAKHAYIGIGSNIGDRALWLREGLRLIRERLDADAQPSSIFSTEPRLDLDQDAFLNAVIRVSSSLAPHELLSELQKIELDLGRARIKNRPKGPRTLDLDLLVYGEERSEDAVLTLPHPGLARRRFVLAPFAEIAPELVPPGFDSTMETLLATCPDDGWIAPTDTRWDGQ